MADKGLPLNERIHKMAAGIFEILMKNPIDKIIMEDPLPRTDKNTNESTYRALNWLQGYVCVKLKDQGYKNLEFILPNSWRSKVGIKTGNKKREVLKEEDMKWVKNQFGIDVNDDIADAIGIGYSSIDSAF